MSDGRGTAPDLRLGDIVNLVGDPDSAYVVIAVSGDYGRVRLVYCGSQRWYVPQWFDRGLVAAAVDSKSARRARRLLDKAGFDPDGWRRITVGRYGAEQRVAVDHVSQRGGSR